MPENESPQKLAQEEDKKEEGEQEAKRKGTVKAPGVRKVTLVRDKTIPCDVYPWFEITLKDINVPEQTFTCSVEIHIFWQDFNLPNIFPQYKDYDIILDDDCVPFKINEIFENKIGLDIVGDPTYKYLEDTATVYCLVVVDCVFTERMELNRFPFDRQFLNLLFNAWTNEGNWNWTLDHPDWVPQEFHKPFCARMISSITEYELLPMWVDFTTDQPFTIRLRVNRKPAYYFGNIVFPNFLIIAGCLAAFVISPDEVGSRLGVTVTLMLAAVAFRFVVSSMLPKVSYLTLMDYYLLTGFIALVILIGENAIVGIKSIHTDVADAIDQIFIIGFSIFWVILHITATILIFDKNLLRIPWEVMDELDKIEDENGGFILASEQDVKSHQETEFSKKMWNKYKNQTVEERAKSAESLRPYRTNEDPISKKLSDIQEDPIQQIPSKVLVNDDNSIPKPKPSANNNTNNSTQNQLASSIMLSSNLTNTTNNAAYSETRQP